MCFQQKMHFHPYVTITKMNQKPNSPFRISYQTDNHIEKCNEHRRTFKQNAQDNFCCITDSIPKDMPFLWYTFFEHFRTKLAKCSGKKALCKYFLLQSMRAMCSVAVEGRAEATVNNKYYQVVVFMEKVLRSSVQHQTK